MIEVAVKLTKGHVFLTGETVECSITFNHQLSQHHKISQSNNDTVENLAWGSAQIHCYCFTGPKVSKAKDKLQNMERTAFAGTALGVDSDSGRTIFATTPKILFCDLKLYPGQTKTYVYIEKIPNDLPPSYRGQLVKYCYKITVGTQRVNHPVKLLRVPIRVLPLVEAMSDTGEICNETTEELTPTNPFLEVRQSENPLNLALQVLQNITARRNPNFYMISNKRGRVARFCLFKPAYKLGEDIIGSLDFTVATVDCMQVSVALQCQEQAIGSQESKLHTFSRHHEVCCGFQHTQLVLPIPLHITPAFSTNLVTLKWNLHFEFVTVASKILDPPGFITSWQAPSEVAIETMVWTLPIRLYSSTPAHVAQGVQSNDLHVLTIR